MQKHMKARARVFWLDVGAGALALLLFGCAQPPSADVMLGGSATPVAVPPGPPGSPDGLYAGTANLILGTCPQTMTISNFRVAGNVVRFGGFEGHVSPDGSVSLLFAGMVLNGRFQGDSFTGRVDTDNDLGIYVRPLRDCLYAIAVRRVAA
jgi:hypothetical protein